MGKISKVLTCEYKNLLKRKCLLQKVSVQKLVYKVRNYYTKVSIQKIVNKRSMVAQIFYLKPSESISTNNISLQASKMSTLNRKQNVDYRK